MKDNLILKNAVVTLALVTSPAFAADPAPEEASSAPAATEAAPEATTESQAEARGAVTLGAGPDAEARVLTTAEETETEAVPATEPAAVASDRTGPKHVPYMKRYVPEPLMWELGIFGGLM